MNRKELGLHWKILIGLLCGVILGVISPSMGLNEWTIQWIEPVGDLFVRFLKLVAIPLVITSLALGVSNTEVQGDLPRLGVRTLLFYLVTTALAIVAGLSVANWLKPGTMLPAEMREGLSSSYSEVSSDVLPSDAVGERSWMQFLAEMVPENLFSALSSNNEMLQVVLVSLLVGLALTRLRDDSVAPIRNLLSGVHELLTFSVEWIMKLAPYGVFALMASVLTELAGDVEGGIGGLLAGLGGYAATVALAMLIHLFVVYGTLYRLLTGRSFWKMIQVMRPAILLGFSTSSSVATLPVTMDRVENGLGIAPAISRLVLPVGTTVNMDGTSIYQAVSALFIAQALGMDLTLAQQGTILFTALMASIGSAGVPGAGVVMLVVVLEAIQVPVEGIALILGLERILDMMRTALNVTGDAVVASLVSATTGVRSEVNGDEVE